MNFASLVPFVNLCCGVGLVGFAMLFVSDINKWTSMALRWLGMALVGGVVVLVLMAEYWERPLPDVASGSITWRMAGYLVASIVTFFVYGYDKKAAVLSALRIPERALHFMGLLGGWPGALIGQLYFNHKRNWRSKWRFQLINWLIVAVHIGLWTVQNLSGN